MKRFLIIITLVAGLTSAKAQTSTNTPQNFVTSVMQFFTSFNTNFPADSSFELWAGSDTVNNDRIMASLGGSVHPTALKGFGVDGMFRNDTALGSVSQAQAGISYSIIHIDTRVSPYLHVGYDWRKANAYAAPGLRVSKMMTLNTFSAIGLELPVAFHNQANLTPTPTLSVGCKF